MRTNKSVWLPFSDRAEEREEQATERTNNDWLVALRHARVPLRPDDRLLVLYGHPVLLSLGLYAVAERAITGEPVVYLDGTQTFDPFFIGRVARVHRQQPRKLLPLIHVARAYTLLQLERLVSDCLSSALDRYEARMAVLTGLFDTIHDPVVSEKDALRSFGRMLEAITRLTHQGSTVLCLCPFAPVLTSTDRLCLDQLRSQANRVIRVREEQGMIQIEDESDEAASSWQVARSLLEPTDRKCA